MGHIFAVPDTSGAKEQNVKITICSWNWSFFLIVRTAWKDRRCFCWKPAVLPLKFCSDWAYILNTSVMVMDLLLWHYLVLAQVWVSASVIIGFTIVCNLCASTDVTPVNVTACKKYHHLEKMWNCEVVRSLNAKLKNKVWEFTLCWNKMGILLISKRIPHLFFHLVSPSLC